MNNISSLTDFIKSYKNKLNLPKIKIYCLTLKDGRRYEKVKQYLEKDFPNNHEIVFGGKFEKDFVHKVLNKNDKVWKMSMFSKNENYLQRAYSCAEGHRRIMQLFLNQNEYDWAIVVEDDFYIKPDIIKQLTPIIEKNTFDVYHLGYFAWVRHRNKNTKFIPKGDAIISFTKWGNSTGCYMVNKNFAIKYYKSFLPISNPSDVQLNNLILAQYKKVPCVNNISCYVDSDLANHSEIGREVRNNK
jgi:hypothetical protein